MGGPDPLWEGAILLCFAVFKYCSKGVSFVSSLAYIWSCYQYISRERSRGEMYSIGLLVTRVTCVSVPRRIPTAARTRM